MKKITQAFLRGGLIPLFLLLHVDMGYCEDNSNATMNHIIKVAIEKKLYESSVWESLLEMTDDRLNIKDPNFILSGDNFSLRNELIKTIQSFFDEPNDSKKHPICRFPARFYWIKSELGLSDSIFPNINCPEFEEYKSRVSAQKIDLVFVSEDVSQPSSMVGHVFLKLSGYDHNSNYVKHAVSFYTVIEPKDIPLLLFKSTITGMKGFFSLLPYNEHIKRYLEVENRNVWEYELNLPEENKLLIYYHIWEMKDLQIKYLYTGYNCATVIYNILSLSSENFSKSNNRLWITPKDVIKEAYLNNLIVDAKLIPSHDWNIRMFSDALDSECKDIIYNWFNNKTLNHLELSEDITKKLYEINLIRSYASYLYRQGEIDEKELKVITNVIKKVTEENMPLDNTYKINLTQYKSPLNTFDDSQLGLGYKILNGQSYMKLFFLPASNTLSDDNREYFNENSLKLGETSLLINNKSINLESFQLYAIKSLIPWNEFVKGISGEFRLGAEQQYDKELNNHLALNVSGGIGLTKNISPDINIYFLFNGGAGYGKSLFYLYPYPEVGATIYEIMNMKTTFCYKYVYNQLGSNDFYNDLDITQSVFWNKKIKLNAIYEHRFNDSNSHNVYELMFHAYF